MVIIDIWNFILINSLLYRIEVIFISIKEYEFEINDFNEPKVLKDKEAIAQLLVRLLLLEPGTIQSHPKMGVGLVSKYRYMMENDLQSLLRDFREQAQTYIREPAGIEINGLIKNKICYLSATIDDTIYAFSYDSDTNNLDYNFKSINEL